MEPTFAFTRSELVDAFNRWDETYLDDPSKFDAEITADPAEGERSADYLLHLLDGGR